ncbi:MAG: hypothetical protein Q7T20_15255 [Saprospiraceae bacterium]|nr:hypothetical protein [Saprospiraceae bacterium]
MLFIKVVRLYFLLQFDSGLGVDGICFYDDYLLRLVGVHRAIDIDAAAARICRYSLYFAAVDPSISGFYLEPFKTTLLWLYYITRI